MSTHDPVYTAVMELINEVEDRDVPDDIKVKLKNIADLMVVRSTHTYSGKSYMKNHANGDTSKLLKFFVSASKAKNVLEVGTFTGCSALMMAEALPHDGTVTTCDFDPYIQEMARGLVDKSPHGYKIKMIQGSGTNTLRDLAKQGQRFDFVFLDEHKPHYIDLFNISIDSLLAPGGTIMADNALFYGSAYDKNIQKERGDAIKKFNEVVAQRTDIYHFEEIMLKRFSHKVLAPLRDGIMMIRRKEDTDGTVKE